MPVAWVMGDEAMGEIDASPQVQFTNWGNVTAGRRSRQCLALEACAG
jgi:hypothetical protein